MKYSLMARWSRKAFASTMIVVLTAVFLSATAAMAQSQSALAVDLKARKVTVADGKESFENADKAHPGDILEYAATYKNTTGGSIHNLKPNLPIPDGSEFVGGTAKPAPAEGSLDGKKFEAFPIKRKVKTADGKEVLREVPASQIRTLRWNVGDLAGGASTTVVARVRVSAK